eukprot:1052150-Amorphochlora_amoeboformis.AAC.1
MENPATDIESIFDIPQRPDIAIGDKKPTPQIATSGGSPVGSDSKTPEPTHTYSLPPASLASLSESLNQHANQKPHELATDASSMEFPCETSTSHGAWGSPITNSESIGYYSKHAGKTEKASSLGGGSRPNPRSPMSRTLPPPSAQRPTPMETSKVDQRGENTLTHAQIQSRVHHQGPGPGSGPGPTDILAYHRHHSAVDSSQSLHQEYRYHGQMSNIPSNKMPTESPSQE